MRSLGGMRILIVEDEFLLAEDIAQHFRNVGAEIVGPVANMAGAYTLLDGVQAAILDINLGGDMVFPLADKLQALGIPFVFFTGYDNVDIPDRFHFASRLSKPSNWHDVALSLMDQSDTATAGRKRSYDIMAMLPKLRLAARIMLQDPEAADRLVERTLQQAVQDGRWPDDMSVPQWLNGLMSRLVEQNGSSFLQ